MHLSFEIDPKYITDSLQGYDHNELFDLIVNLELLASDFDLTERLCRHFINECRKELNLTKEEFDVTAYL